MTEPEFDADIETEAALRARLPSLRRRPLLPVPEIAVLLDAKSRFVRVSSKYAGNRLPELHFEEDLSVHEVFHPDCKDPECKLLKTWLRAWESHRSGLPIEWLWLSPRSQLSLKMRLQTVSYACGVLFGDSVYSYADHSVLFVQDLSAPEQNGKSTDDASAETTHIENAVLYMQRRASDFDPNLIASLDKRLRKVTGRLLVAQERERKKLAADLHDGLGQTLSLLRLDVEILQEWASKHADHECRGALDRVYDQVKRGLQELRNVTNHLHAQVVGDAGLFSSLDVLRADFRSVKPNIELGLDMTDCRYDIPPEIAVAVYRVVQEGLNNIAQHSKAESADIELSADQRGVHLVIRDDGIGIDEERIQRRGLGLTTMRERAERLSGTFTIDAPSNGGCRITVRWPINVVASLGNETVFNSIGGDS